MWVKTCDHLCLTFYEKYFNSESLCLPGSQFNTLEMTGCPTVMFSANSTLQKNVLESTQSGSSEVTKVLGLPDYHTTDVNASVVTSETCLLLWPQHPLWMSKTEVAIFCMHGYQHIFGHAELSYFIIHSFKTFKKHVLHLEN